MLYFTDLQKQNTFPKPCVLTLGNFDGVHIGHEHLFLHIAQMTKLRGTRVIITFSTHPSHVLAHAKPVCLLTSQNQKIQILKDHADVLYNVDFTPEFAEKTYVEFLQDLKNACSFTHLILGEGSRFGKQREGTPHKVKDISKRLDFSAVYIPPKKQDGEIISSQTIRTYIQKGDLKEAEKLLGRPFSIETTLQNESLLTNPHQCLPPDGTYKIHLQNDSQNISTTLFIKKRKLTLDLDLSSLKEKKSPYFSLQFK